MKRHLFMPSADRWVSVEDGTVRDLDDNQLGGVKRSVDEWYFSLPGSLARFGAYVTQAAALAALLADPSCPTPGPNR